MREKLSTINLRVTVAALVLSCIMTVVCASSADAQNPLLGRYNGQNSISRDIMRSEAKRGIEQVGRYGTDSALGQKLFIPPLPGDQSFTDSGSDPKKYLTGESKIVPDFGANERKNVNITLPPLKGLRQILDSKVTKQLLKDLTAAEATVLMQTYMMVENGAATGFMGGMNIGSNLMSNMLQAQDYQLKLMDITDDTGKMKEAYVKKVAKLMQDEKYLDVWPAALYMASGEDGAKTNLKTMDDLKAGTDPYDFAELDGTGTGTTGGNTDTRLLSDMLFVKGDTAGGNQAYKNEKIENLKKDFIHLVGDVEIKIEKVGNSKTARAVNLNFKAAARDESGTRRGVAAANWEEVQVVWQNTNTILYDLCQWKKTNQNSTKEVFKMETSASTKDIGKDGDGLGDPWELASAPDVPLTMNVLEQLYTIIQKNRPQKEIQCEELKLTEKDIPDEGGTSGNTANLNDCGPNKGCLKNRVILHLSFLTARSRTLHTYRTLYSISKRFATEPLADELVDRAFTRAFAGMNIDDELRVNRARYSEFVGFMAQLAQGDAGAGAFFRPGSNEAVQPGSGGFNK